MDLESAGSLDLSDINKIDAILMKYGWTGI